MSIFFFQLRYELRKLFAKKRTYIGFGTMLLAQFIISAVFRHTHVTHPLERVLNGNGYSAAPYISVLTIATYMLIPLNDLLLPLYTSLVGGDLVAKEVEDGTMRMILSRPISRIRLLFLKWITGLVFSATLVISLGCLGLLMARLFFPWGNFCYWNPVLKIFGVFDGDIGLLRYLLAHALMIVNAFFLLSLAFMFSCFNVKPAAATILALSLMFANLIMEKLFQDYEPYFLTYHTHLWQWVFMDRIPWWQVGESLSVLIGVSATCLIAGCLAFQRRDFKT